MNGAALAHRDRSGRASADNGETGARNGRLADIDGGRSSVGHAHGLSAVGTGCYVAEAYGGRARRELSDAGWLAAARGAGIARAAR